MITVRRVAHATRSYTSSFVIVALTSAAMLSFGPAPLLGLQMAIDSTTFRVHGLLSKLGFTGTRA